MAVADAVADAKETKERGIYAPDSTVPPGERTAPYLRVVLSSVAVPAMAAHSLDMKSTC